MGTRGKRAARCEACRLHVGDCVCALSPRLTLSTQVLVLMHKRELHKTSATVHLAVTALTALEVRVRGREGEPLDLASVANPERRPLLLFPSARARCLGPELLGEDARPITLIVPDGSWRQASKVARREPLLAGVPHVTLADLGRTRWGVRRERRADGLATYEAISRALGCIEGPGVQRQLDAYFDEAVARTLASRNAMGARSRAQERG